MKNKQYFMLLITFTACIVSWSEGYGIKKFSQSFSSSSASSHASSYSSSSSYAYNGGQNPGQLDFIHEIPKANAVASASATAGLATATASANASAHVGGGADLYSHDSAFNQNVPNKIGSGSHSGSRSYSVGGSYSETPVNSKENIRGISHPYTHMTHDTIPAILPLNDGSKSVRHHYSSATANAHASSGSFSFSQSQGIPNAIGGGSHSDGGSSLEQQSPILFKPVQNDYTSSGGLTSSDSTNSKDDSDQNKRGYNYQISPNKMGNIGSFGSGSYSSHASQSIGDSNIHDTIRGETFKQGYHNSIGTTTQRSDNSYSTAAQSSANEDNGILHVSTHTFNNDNLVSSHKTAGYGHSNTGSYSLQSSLSPSMQNNHVIVSSTSAPSQETLSRKVSGSQVEDGSYSSGDHNSPIDGDDGSYSYQDKPKNNRDFGSGSYSVGYSNTATNREAASHSNNKYVGGAYNIAESGNEEKGGSYSTAGSKVSVGSTGQTNSKPFHPVAETPAPHHPNVYSKKENPQSKPHQHVFPGPDGSIYDYKVPSLQSNIHTSQSSLVQSGTYGGSQSVTSAGNTIGSKHCCKGPFPGPSGSIHDSKPSSFVGTAVKTTVSHPPLTRVTPKTPIINDFPGPSGSIYTSKPVVTNIDNNHQNNNQWSTSASSGTYQRVSGSSSSRLPLCTTSSPCTNAPQLIQQSTPSSNSKLPVVHNKYVNEIDKKAHNQNINKYIPPQYDISEDNKSAQNSVTAFRPKTTNQQIGYSINENESNKKNSFSLGVTQSQSTSTGHISSDVHTDIHSQIPKNHHGVPNFMGEKQEFPMFSNTPSFVVGEQENYQKERNKVSNNPSSFVGYTQPHDQNVSDKEIDTHTTGSVLYYNDDSRNSNIGSSISNPPYSVGTEINIERTHQKPIASNTLPASQLLTVIGQNKQQALEAKQNSHGNLPSHGTSSYYSNSKTSSSMTGKTISGDSQFTFSNKPIDITTTIEKQVPNVYTNNNGELILEPVGISTTIAKQVPQVHSNGIPDSITNPVAVITDFEAEKPKTYTSSVYIDIKKPSKVIDLDSIIFEKPASISFDKNAYHFVGGAPHGSVNQHEGSRITFSSSGSSSYGSSSRGYTGSSKHSCGMPTCETSYRQYSNAVPSHVSKTSVIPIGTMSSSGYLVGAGSGNSAGNFGASAQVGSGGFSSSGSYSGVFPKKQISSDDGSGGFLSSIYIHNTPIHSAYADSHAKAGSFSTSKSLSKANSYASSSSFASSSSGSYSSHHY
ncbi:hypothetical protein WA026_010633 [Henosepilachna vigintioctopunctata]|uniref:Uncharacterized protein n=1 Tax=Henosepilachna vigintioctopunctata TaxID=420089 RepID=A0AAW1V4E3_9CUCU